MSLNLFVKASKDGTSIGDCPFCQKAAMALHANNVNFDVTLIDLSNKPEDFLKTINPKGSVPCAVIKETSEIITDSDEIIQKACPDFIPTEIPNDIKEVTNIFTPFVKLIKNKDTNLEPDLKNDLKYALSNFDNYIKASVPNLIGGNKVGYLDCKVAPILFHIEVAGQQYKGFNFNDLESLQNYKNRVFSTEEYQKTKSSEDEVIFGWSKFFV